MNCDEQTRISVTPMHDFDIFSKIIIDVYSESSAERPKPDVDDAARSGKQKSNPLTEIRIWI